MTEPHELLSIDRLAFDRLHDIIWEVTNNSLELPDVIAVWNNLPRNIKLEAMQWGMDTCVSDEIYVHLQKEKDAKALQDA